MLNIISIIDIIPILFIFKYVYDSRKLKKIALDKEMVSLFGGGSTLSRKSILIFLLFVVTSFTTLLLQGLSIIPTIPRPFMIFGCITTLSIVFFSFSNSVYIGKESLLVGNKMYVKNQVENIKCINNNNEKFPIHCTITTFDNKVIKSYVPIKSIDRFINYASEIMKRN